jgi:hypothetical protein
MLAVDLTARVVAVQDQTEPVEQIAARAQQQLMDKVVYERWCPHTGAGVSSF